jgi:acetyltransferase-like isoleucine patch superfamily enzyme
MKALAYKLLTLWQRRKLRAFGPRVSIPMSARLLRAFAVRFLATPEDRNYLAVGENCLLNGSFIFEARTGEISLGNRCYIGANSSILCRNRVSLGDDVTIAWDVTIYDHDSHSMDWRDRAKAVQLFYERYGKSDCFDRLDWTNVGSAPILIGDRVWIGFGATILKGVTIGEGAIVASRSVVTQDIEPYTIVAGNPARAIRKLETL